MAEGKLNEKANTALRRDRPGGNQPGLRPRGGAQSGRRGVALDLRAADVGDAEMAAFEAALGLPAIHRAQAGLLADMDYVADVLYNRVG